MGCRACRQTGYHGRHGIFEMMEMNYEVRQMMLKACSSGEIGEAARRHGMRTLGDDGWRLVRKGITTPEEVMRVTKDQTLGEPPKSGGGGAVEDPANTAMAPELTVSG